VRREPIFLGQRFARLTVIRPVKPGLISRFVVRCDCGVEREVHATNLRNSTTRSCGCLQREEFSARRKKHGLSESPTYATWLNMRTRVTNPKRDFYDCYGGRGISICDAWSDFAVFLADMGERPSSAHTLERVDVNRGYAPDNCVWATIDEQANNRRSNHRLTFKGETLTLTQWARRLGLNVGTLSSRIHNSGWSVEKALSTPTLRPGSRA